MIVVCSCNAEKNRREKVEFNLKGAMKIAFQRQFAETCNQGCKGENCLLEKKKSSSIKQYMILISKQYLNSIKNFIFLETRFSKMKKREKDTFCRSREKTGTALL